MLADVSAPRRTPQEPVIRWMWVLAVAGLGLTLSAATLTFLPWLAASLRVVPGDLGIVLSLVAPALAVLALIGCACSTAATLLAGRGGSAGASALGLGGFALFIAYWMGLALTGLHGVVLR